MKKKSKLHKGFSGNAIRSGFYSSKPISAEFKQIYDVKCEELKRLTLDDKLIDKVALTYIQLAQGRRYTDKTGLLPTTQEKIEAKKRLLKRLEQQIKERTQIGTQTKVETPGTQELGTPDEEIGYTDKEKKEEESDEFISFGGATVSKKMLPEEFARLKELKGVEEAKQRRWKELNDRIKQGNPPVKDWWEQELYGEE